MVKGMNRLVLLGLALVLLAGLAAAGWHWQQQRVVQQAYEAGMAAADADRYEEALALALPYADRHDPDIDHLLARIYINGPDGIKDIDKGLTHRRAAADAGNMRSAFYLAMWLIEEDATDEAIKNGLSSMKQFADCGMPIASYYLGTVLMEGTVTPLNLKSSMDYLDFAAWAGIATAQLDTFIAYSKLEALGKSRQTELDVNDALYWLIIADRNGVPEASRILNKVIQENLESGNTGPRDLIESLTAEADRRSTMIGSPDYFQCGFKPPSP